MKTTDQTGVTACLPLLMVAAVLGLLCAEAWAQAADPSPQADTSVPLEVPTRSLSDVNPGDREPVVSTEIT